MLTYPVVILVGNSNTGKTRFYCELTNSLSYHPTTKCMFGVTSWIDDKYIIIDTPGTKQYRKPGDYSWENTFKHADIILDFGGWSEDEVYGVKTTSPKYMTWSGDNQETMKRIEEYLQGR